MKDILFSLLFSIIMFTGINAQDQSIQWTTWGKVQEQVKVNPKPILVDVYTSWCGWCKKMDKTTLIDTRVISYINTHMYAIKFDAEVKYPIVFDGVEYNNLEQNRKHGSHELANAILNNVMEYPTFVYFNENLERITISMGYKDVDTLIKEMKFAKNKIYLKESFSDYMAK